MVTIDLALMCGAFDPTKRDGFIEFESEGGNGKMYLQLEVYIAFLRMREAAAADGIHLFIVSAFRSFEKQKELWESKWYAGNSSDKLEPTNILMDPLAKAKKIMEYTAPPGFSRHHWGTEIDLNSVEPDFFNTESGQLTYQWLNQHASSFGFCQTYNAFNPERPFGFQEEQWHWSYKPSSYPIWSTQIKQFDHMAIIPFEGADTVLEAGLLDYIRNVNHCPGI